MRVKSITRLISLNNHLYFLALSSAILLVILLSIGFIRFSKVYNNTRDYFNKINNVVAGRADFESLFKAMEDVKYDKINDYKNALRLYSEGKVEREYVINYVKDFATFLRIHEQKHLLEVKNLSIILTIISFSFGLFLSFSIYNFTKIKTYTKDILKTFDDISRKIYIEEVPPRKIEYEEDLKINKSIDEINKVRQFHKLLEQFKIDSSIDDYINTVGPLLCGLFNSHRFSIALIDWNKKVITAETAFILNPAKKALLRAGFSQKFEQTSLSKMLEENRRYRIINNLKEHFEKTHSKSTSLILEEGFKSNLTVVASINEEPFGFFFLSSENEENYSENDARLFLALLNLLSYRLYFSLVVQHLLSNMGSSLVDLVEFKDTETGNHVKRVANYSRIIAEELGLAPKLTRLLYLFAPLHDIGKVGIPDRILLKPGKLTEDEWEIMKKHVEYGETILKRFIESSKGIINEDILNCMVNVISDHHEKHDGNGYPKGKKGEEISIEGRIVALADVFDALTTKRPYKEPIDFDIAVEMIKNDSGKHFDPSVVSAFVNRLNEVRHVYNELKD